jgi:hypothetical protein
MDQHREYLNRCGAEDTFLELHHDVFDLSKGMSPAWRSRFLTLAQLRISPYEALNHDVVNQSEISPVIFQPNILDRAYAEGV